jgi:hypothetical protein
MNEASAYQLLRGYRDAELWCDQRGCRIIILGQPTIWIEPDVGLAVVRRQDVEQVSGAPLSVQKWRVRSGDGR